MRMRTNRLGSRWIGLLCAVLLLSVPPACNRPPGTATVQAASPALVATPELTNPARGAVLLPGGLSIADVAAKVTPSVVNVFSEKKVGQAESPQMSPFFSDPFFHFFFDQPGRSIPDVPERQEKSLGSGVIVASDGLIITNNHVVAQADKIRVALQDGREFDAKLVGSDPKSDVAVLRVDAKDLTAIQFADSSKIRIGDLVLAIGNPFGLGQTVTMGIISAVGRANMGITDYEDFIQTDAAINPGNSGGALVTMDGSLVGINSAILSRSGGYQGVGFAIPSNMVLQVKDSILKFGKVVRGWLGVAIQDLTEDLSKSLNVSARSGVLVSDVTPDSPAAKVGIQRGDVITAVDGAKTTDSAHLRNLIALAGKDKKVRIELLRAGKQQSFEVALGELPVDANVPGSGAEQSETTGLFEGISVRDLDASTRERLHLPPNLHGVLVSRVDPQTHGASVGLHPGDIVLEVNRVEISSVSEFRKAATQIGRRALILVYRDGVTVFMSLSR